MDKLTNDAHDALVAFEERQKRHAQGYAPRPRAVPAGVWSPRMTEQQQREHDQYVKDHNLPF